MSERGEQVKRCVRCGKVTEMPFHTCARDGQMTPGPWCVGAVGHNGHLVIHADNGTTNVCTVFGTALTVDPAHPMNRAQAANARAIAALPDVLGVLREACERLMDAAGVLGDAEMAPELAGACEEVAERGRGVLGRVVGK
jgi:hypothetical protein